MGQGQSVFEIEEECGSLGLALDCRVKFGSNGEVLSMGSRTPGRIEGNSDIAGKGTLIAFLVPSGLALIIALVLITALFIDYCVKMTQRAKDRAWPNKLKKFLLIPHPRSLIQEKGSEERTLPERTYDMLESALVTISDTQLFLSLALLFNFSLVAKCQLSLYHFRVATNLIEIACGNAVLVLAILRGYWTSLISALIRVVMIVVVFSLLNFNLSIEGKRAWVAERLPPKTRSDSAVLLNAACLLDPGFKWRVFDHLTDDERAAIGVYGRAPSQPAWIFLIILIIVWAIAWTQQLVTAFKYYQLKGTKTIEKKYRSKWLESAVCSIARLATLPCEWLPLVISISTWIFIATLFIFNTVYILQLRSWVGSSGWLNQSATSDSENDIRGFGQLAALFSTLGIITAAFDRHIPYRKASTTKRG